MNWNPWVESSISKKFTKKGKMGKMVINDSLLNNCPKLDFSSQKCQMMIYMRILVLVIEKSITKIEEIAKTNFDLVWSVLTGHSRERSREQQIATSNTRSWPRIAGQGQVATDRCPDTIEDSRSQADRDSHVPGNMDRYKEHYPVISDRDQCGSVTPGQHRSKPDHYRGPPQPTRSPATSHRLPQPATAVDHRRPLETAAAGHFSGQLWRIFRPTTTGPPPAVAGENSGQISGQDPIFDSNSVSQSDSRFETRFVIRLSFRNRFPKPVMIPESD